MGCDFKSNVELGKGATQESQQYYHTSHRQLLGLWLSVPQPDGKCITKNFDLISRDLTKDAAFVINAFKILFETKEFKDLKIKKFSLWSDGGKHFRNW